jgi:gamma-glutamyltranspeptidase / glutathione hydrolase
LLLKPKLRALDFIDSGGNLAFFVENIGKTTMAHLLCRGLIGAILGIGFNPIASLAAFPRPAKSQQAMVATAHPLATAAGLEVMQVGGNAIDAAVASTLAISVVEPFSAGIGGGGFLLVQTQAGIEALDFRERAPQKASRNMYLDANGKVKPNASLEGHLAAGIPGTVSGLAALHRKYGKLSWARVVRPSIRLANEGFTVSDILAEQLRGKSPLLVKNPAARQIFVPNGRPWKAGEKLVQKDLAKTLRAIAQDPNNFYRGTIARTIARDMVQNGGLITTADLSGYQSRWREPLCGPFRQYRVCSMPPPSSGGVHLLQILNLIGDKDLKGLGWHSPDSLHFLAESMRIAYADRSQYLGDPSFTQVPVTALTSPAYGALRRRDILSTARSSKEVKPVAWEVLRQFEPNAPVKSPVSQIPQGESQDTSHLTVVDRERQVVTLTFTVNYRFGAGVVVPGTGILLNDEMDDFAIAPGVPNVFGLVGGAANEVAPGKTPLSSMTPTIVTEGGRFRLALGAPGGSTIITTVLQILLNNLIYEMNIAESVAAGRMHHQWLPDKLAIDPWGFDPATVKDLEQRGHSIERRGYWGNANAIQQRADGSLEGAADPRGEGTAQGF